jgi:hypothetical protein
LNVANGTNPRPIADPLARADALLGAFAGKLPYGVQSSSGRGQDMVTTASILESYNTGYVTDGCAHANRPPVANAGPDQTVPLGAVVTLNGGASTDPDGDALRFRWSFISKPAQSAATLVDPTGVTTTFVVDAPGRDRADHESAARCGCGRRPGEQHQYGRHSQRNPIDRC